tara:strand:+ start:58 stop:231 length:174 start_codon:yes stop_codon:yes gene_type:complete
MKVGQLVEYTHWQFDPLLTPKIRFGTILKEPNEVGKVLVIFGEQKMWVWSGDLSLVK